MDDIIQGTNGDDNITAADDNISIDAGAGNDMVTFAGDKSSINGGAGDDNFTIIGEKNLISGGGDNDNINVTGDKNSIDGGTGNDDIRVVGNMNTIIGSKGNDFIHNNNYNYRGFSHENRGTVYVYGGGHDTIECLSDDNVIVIEGYTWSIVTDDSNNVQSIDVLNDKNSVVGSITLNEYYGTGDIKIVSSKAAVDSINFITNDDSNKKINGTSGADIITNDKGKNLTINGGAGNDSIWNRYGDADNNNVSIDAGDGNDFILNGAIAGCKGVTVSGGAGNDYFRNVGAGVVYVYTDGNDTINGLGGSELFSIVLGDVKVKASIQGGDGTVLLSLSNKKTLTLQGFYTENINIVSSLSEVPKINFIDVKESNTVITGKEQTGVIDFISNAELEDGSHAENFTIKGSKGTYFINNVNNGILFDLGTGNDSIYNGWGSNVTINGGAGDDEITSYNASKNILNGGAGNDNFDTGDDNVTVNGGIGDDFINIDASTNELIVYNAGDGNDSIYCFDSNSTLNIVGSSYSTEKSGEDLIVKVGKDKITLLNAANLSKLNIIGLSLSGGGDDTVESATLTVTDKTKSPVTVSSAVKVITASKRTKGVNITGNDNANSIVGGSGKDMLYGGKGNDTILGNAGNDKLYGEAGDDSISGGVGNDTLIGGTGNDTLVGGAGKDIYVYSAGDGNDLITDYASEDKIQISGTAKVTTSGNDIIFTVGKGKLTVKDGKGKTISYSDNDGEQTYPKSDVSLKGKTIKLLENYFEDDFKVSDYGNAIQTIDASAVIHDISITANKLANKIIGSAENDTLIGGKSNDTLTGGKGSDVFVYANGDGNDIITDYTEEDMLKISSGTISKIITSGKNVIFTVGKGKISVTGGANKVIHYEDAKGTEHFYPVNFNTAGTGATLLGAYNKDDFNTEDYGDYAGTLKTIDAATVTNALKITGNKLTNNITGSAEDDYIDGGAGKDSIFGNDGNDTLIGGKGNDTLTGSDGADVFVYSNGDGNDIITDYTSDDKIKIAKGTVKVEKKNKDVIFTVGDGKITVKGAADKVVTYIDSSGKTNYYPKPTKDSVIINGTDVTVLEEYKSDTFDVGNVKNGNKVKRIDASPVSHDLKIIGNAKANVILGGFGNDTIYGGKNNDTLQGGDGKDIFVYESGDGSDVILDYNSEDTIKITKGKAKVTTKGSDVVFTIDSGKITLQNAAGKKVSYIDASGEKKSYSSAPLFIEDDTDYELSPNLSSLVQSKATDYSFVNTSTNLVKENNLLAYTKEK